MTATRLSYEKASFRVRKEAPSGILNMPDGGGGWIVTGLVVNGSF